MKKTITLITLFFLTIMPICAIDDIVFNMPIHHLELYGEEGENLFPKDENGFAVLTGIVECPGKSVEEIKTSVMRWFHEMVMTKRLDVDSDEKYETNNQLMFKGELKIGHKEIGSAGLVGPFKWVVSETDIKFIAKIDIKEGKFRYTFFDIKADRYRLSGKPETEGVLNDLHWQRVNCLTEKLEKEQSYDIPSKKKIEEYQAQIKYEDYLYHAEYDAMTNMVERLKNCWKDEDLDF